MYSIYLLFKFQIEKNSLNIFLKIKLGFLIHYPIPPHQQEALADYSKYSFPVTEKIHQQVVSIPISPVLNNDHIKKIIEVLNSY